MDNLAEQQKIEELYQENNDIDKPRSLMEHLEELRNRILYALLLTIVCTALVYTFIGKIMDFVTKPIGKLYFMGPTEAFWVQVKLAFFVGLYCALPFIFYQIWRFIEVGLRKKERGMVLFLSIVSFLLFSLGGAFCYIVVIPVAIKFLLSYGSETLIALISVSKYISFIGCLVFAFGITFQLPLILLFLGRAGIVNAQSLKKFRRFAILGSFIIGAALTPTPDMVNQSLLALPIIMLYELSIWLVMIFEKKNQ
ncbi:MAG: twin-arginine translocase subunit TatC [Candidatus Omnitrophota bacterium]